MDPSCSLARRTHRRELQVTAPFAYADAKCAHLLLGSRQHSRLSLPLSVMNEIGWARKTRLDVYACMQRRSSMVS
jgi:hypothetical protein